MRSVQPIGAFPFPAGLLLVPDSGDAAAGDAASDPELAAAVAGLAAGRLPARWPAALAAHGLAHAGEIEAALAAVADGDGYAAYNRWVLDPGTADQAAVAATLPPELLALVDVVRFTNGELDEPPALGDGAADVVAALVLATQAAHRLPHADPESAVALLKQGAARADATAPALAAILRGNAGTIAYEQLGDTDSAVAGLQAALQGLADTHLLLNRAELHYQLGTIEHERAVAAGGALQGAMHHYYTTLQLITADDAPYLWASAQMNLSAAYLASPMTGASDQLRMGIAIQALRAALQVFSRERYPAEWATATVNLAGALVYTPSVKQGDNLVEAVELYEQVLEVRDRHSDPIGRARVLASQGNALAHLGIFDQAKAKLHEARFLFEEQLDHDAVLTVRSLLDEIVKQTTPEHGREGSGRLAMAGADGLRAGAAANPAEAQDG